MGKKLFIVLSILLAVTMIILGVVGYRYYKSKTDYIAIEDYQREQEQRRKEADDKYNAYITSAAFRISRIDVDPELKDIITLPKDFKTSEAYDQAVANILTQYLNILGKNKFDGKYEYREVVGNAVIHTFIDKSANYKVKLTVYEQEGSGVHGYIQVGEMKDE